MTGQPAHDVLVEGWKPYPAYKASGLEWFGDIPAGWDLRRLKHVAEVNLSNVDKKTVDGQNPVRLCNYVDVYYNDRITADLDFMRATATPEQVRKFSLQRGDVLITKDSESWDDIAVPAVVAEELPGVLCGYHLAHIRPLDGCHGPFLSYAFAAIGPRDQFHVAANGITRYGLGGDTIRNGVFALPPLPEQRAIAAFLDRETAEIDALVADKERLVELLQEERTALISHVVTKGLDPSAPMKDSGVEWLGEIPRHWTVLALKRTARKGYKTFTDGDWIESPFIQDEGVRLLQTGNVGVGLFREQGYRYISEESFYSLRCTEVCEGDVLICRLDGPVGRACLAPSLESRMITSVDNAILKVNSEHIDARFLVYFMSSREWIEWIAAICRVGGGFRLRISRTMLGDLPIAHPPLREQELIADYLDSATSNINDLTLEIRGAIEKLKEYRTALISAVVTGKIDVREAV